MSCSPLTGLVYIPAMYGNYPLIATREDDNPMGQKLSISMRKDLRCMRSLARLGVSVRVSACVGSGLRTGSLAGVV